MTLDNAIRILKKLHQHYLTHSDSEVCSSIRYESKIQEDTVKHAIDLIDMKKPQNKPEALSDDRIDQSRRGGAKTQ